MTLLSLCSADVSAEVLTVSHLTVLIKCYLQLRPFATTSLHRLQQNRPSCTCDRDTLRLKPLYNQKTVLIIYL